jgi:hypothetical protein
VQRYRIASLDRSPGRVDPPTKAGPDLSDAEFGLAVVKPKRAAAILACSETYIYDLINLASRKG